MTETLPQVNAQRQTPPGVSRVVRSLLKSPLPVVVVAVFQGQPVAEKPATAPLFEQAAVLRRAFVDEKVKAFHRLPVALHEAGVAGGMPDRVGHGDEGIGPIHASLIELVAGLRRHDGRNVVIGLLRVAGDRRRLAGKR